MSRNLDRRVEAVIPIYDPVISQEIRHIIGLQLADNTKARWIDAKQMNSYKREDGPQREAQKEIYHYLQEKLK